MELKTILSFIKDLIRLRPDWSGAQLRDYIADSSALNLAANSGLLKAVGSALADSDHWTEEAATGTLPDIATMHLDWSELEAIEIDAYDLQELSFEFAKMKAQVS
jgi:hypothetical protein